MVQSISPSVSNVLNGPASPSELVRQAEKAKVFLEVEKKETVKYEPVSDWKVEKVARGADPQLVFGIGLSEKALECGAVAQARELDRVAQMREALGFASASTAFLNALRRDLQEQLTQPKMDIVL